MKYAEFKRNVSVISLERCPSIELHPLRYGIERSLFEEQKLHRLVALAEEAGYATAERRKEAWLRQLARIQANRIRMEKIHAEVSIPTAQGLAHRVGKR